MEKKSLYQMVTEILSDIDGDEVVSIHDTVESAQVAQVVRSTYEAMMTNRDWPHLVKLISLIPSSDQALPTHMKLPDKCKRLISLNYNVAAIGEERRQYRPMKWVDPDHFLMLANQEDNTKEWIDSVIDPSGIELSIRNDRAPTRFTSFDDETLVFNSYDRGTELSLQESKIQARAEMYPEWRHEDDFIPDIPTEAIPALMAEATSTASLRVRQVADQKAEQESSRQQRWLARNKRKLDGGQRYPDYGRKSRKGYRDPTFRRD